MTYAALKKELNSKKYSPIYVLHGEANWHIDELTKKFEQEIIDEGLRDFNLTILYGRDSSIETIVGTARRAPMMSTYQVVIVKEMQLLSGSLEGLIPYINQPSPSTILVLQYKGKKMNGTLKTTKLLKKSDETIMCEPSAPKENAIPIWISQRVAEFSLKISERNAHMMAQYIGTDLSKVDNEIQKLRLNLKEGSSITEADIERYVGISREYNFFELENAVSIRDIEKSFRIVAYAEKKSKGYSYTGRYDHVVPQVQRCLYIS